MKRIRVAHPSVDMYWVIEGLLQDAFARGTVDVTHYRNRQAALDVVTDDPPDLLIAYIDLAQDRSSSIVPCNGLALVRDVRAAGLGLPAVLIAPCMTPELSADVRSLANVGLVLEGRNHDSDLRAQVRTALEQAAPVRSAAAGGQASAQPPPPRKDLTRFVIDIRLRRDGNCNYTAWSRGGRVPYKSDKRFSVGPGDLTDLIDRSKKVANAEAWPQDYRAIGKRLREVLFQENLDVVKEIEYVRGRMFDENPNSIPSIRFIVEHDVHFIALEALLDDQDEFWMQRAPISRQLDVRVTQFPLFQDAVTLDAPINCLIIDANAQTCMSALQHRFEPLPGVMQEADWLAGHLRDQKSGRIGKIGRIWRDAADGEVHTSIAIGAGAAEQRSSGGTFRAALRGMLSGDVEWHIVHFAGHSHYDAAGDCGYVVLPGKPPKDPGNDVVGEVVGTPLLADWLSRTRFVYMSSCRGSSADFVFHFCKCGVPAVAGFRWDVDDVKAKEHSQLFYEELLERRSLEDAFVETWKQMYSNHRMDRVWTSPELIVQLAA